MVRGPLPLFYIQTEISSAGIDVAAEFEAIAAAARTCAGKIGVFSMSVARLQAVVTVADPKTWSVRMLDRLHAGDTCFDARTVRETAKAWGCSTHFGVYDGPHIPTDALRAAAVGCRDQPLPVGATEEDLIAWVGFGVEDGDDF